MRVKMTGSKEVCVARKSSTIYSPYENPRHLANRRLLLLLGVGIALPAALYGPAHAQAQDASRNGNNELEEIVVTGFKREASLQEVSLAVSTVSGQRLKEIRPSDIKDIQMYIPGLTIKETMITPLITSRGLGTNSNSLGVDPSVGFYMDETVINAPQAQFFMPFDLDRIEVYRGPQGTLFGRNTTGGAIQLITAKPTESFEAYAQASAGRFELVETEGAISGPISDMLRGRIAWRTISRNGFGVNEFTGNDIDDDDRRALRAHLEFLPASNFDILVTGEYQKKDDRSGGLKFQELLFPEGLVVVPGEGGFPTGGPRDISSEFDPLHDREDWAVSSTATWDVTESFTLKNIASYRESDALIVQDLDFSSVRSVGETIQYRASHIEQFTEELQALYSGDFFGRQLDMVAGFFFMSEEFGADTEVGLTPRMGNERRLPDGTLTTQKRVDFEGVKDTDSWALFWNARYAVLPDVTIKLGGRFTRDDITVTRDNQVFAGPNLIMPASGVEGAEFDEYTPEAGIEWRPTENAMLFYTFSQGAKAGTKLVGTPGSNFFVAPEQVNNHEFGLKSSWLDGSLTFNVAGFFYEADDLQLQITLPTGVGGFSIELRNAASQDAHGIEIDTQWQPVQGLRLSGSLAWLETKFGEGFVAVDPLNPEQITNPTEASEELGGNQAPQSPEWSASAHAEYDLPLKFEGGIFTLGADLSYTGDHFFNEFNNERQSQDSYVIFDSRLRFETADERWSAEIWGKNLFNERVQTAGFAIGTGQALTTTFLPPVTWGGTIAFRY